VAPSVSSKGQKARGKPQVSAYLASLPPDTHKVLRTLRAAIRTAAPDAEEGFSYGIPAFKVNGRMLIWYAGWKSHSSLYPITASVKRELSAQLKRYETSKATVRFPLQQRLPLTLVKRIVKARLAEMRRKP